MNRHRTICRITHIVFVGVFIPFCIILLEMAALRVRPVVDDPFYRRAHPEVRFPEYAERDQISGEDRGEKVSVDITHVSDGYVAAVSDAAAKAKLCIWYDGERRCHTLRGDGEAQFFPLVSGNGSYTFGLYTHIEETRYKNVAAGKAEVEMEDELAPFLLPNALVYYEEDSAMIDLAHAIAANASDALEVVRCVNAWVSEHMEYDAAKAEALEKATDYTPDLGKAIAEQKGICLDFAALTAALLRINGVPCKLVVGDLLVEGQPVAHAWNEVWLEEEGWIDAELHSMPNGWQKIDATVASGYKKGGDRVGDFSYTARYCA